MDIQEGSYGGRYGKDGLDAVDTLYANTRNNPIEDIESHFPLRVTQYELLEDRGGAGRWRGGLGSTREIEFLDEAGCSLEGDGSVWAPPGLFGGEPGAPGAVLLNRGAGDEQELPSKFPYRKATAGDRLCLISPCGGGYGDPLERDRDAVRADIADGYVSRESARDRYDYKEIR
jgi:N-methylhydantoinase B